MPTLKLLAAAWLVLCLTPSVAAANDIEWLLARGQAALGEANASDAYALFQEGMQKAPGDLRFVFLGGVAAERAGKLDAALGHLNEVKQKAPAAYPTTDFHIGRALFKKGEYKAAERILTAYTQQQADDPLGFVWLGEAQLRLGKDEAAFQAFNRAGKPEPRLRPVFHFTRGSRVFDANPQDGIKELRRAVELDQAGRVAPFAEQMIGLVANKAELERWYSLDTALGFQNDSNMLLNTEADGSLRYSGLRSVFTLAAFARPQLGDNFFLGVGAAINEARTLSADASGKRRDGTAPTLDNRHFNVGSHNFFIDGALHLARDNYSLEPGLEYSLHWGRLADETYDLSHSIYPRLTWFHSAWNATKFYGITQVQSYYDIEDVAPLGEQRSGTVFGGGVAEYWVFSGRLDAITAFGEYIIKQSDSKAEQYGGPRIGINGRKQAVADLYVDAGAFLAYRSYSDADAHAGETLIGLDGGMGYLFFEHLEIDLNVAYIKNASDENFAYNRLLTGVFIRGIF